MRTLLVTVGTSLLNNTRRELNNNKEVTLDDMISYLRQSEPKKASAETNSLSRLLQEGDRVILIHSQTNEGKLCAEALARYYRQQAYDTNLIEVKGLTYTESRFKMRGLRSLVVTLVEQIREERKQQREVLINATGGFKAEIAYATLVGLLFDVPVYYIHEAFQDIIEMPPTPIAWDYTLWAEYEEFFEWLRQDLRPTHEVDARLKALPPEVHLLLIEEEGFTFLSPAGEAFYEAYQERLLAAAATPVYLSTKARASYEKMAPEVQRRFRRLLKQLRIPEARKGSSEPASNSDCMVYPRGNREGRIFYFLGDDNQAIYVCELARHGDQSYERLLKKGVWRCDYQFEDKALRL